MDSRNTNFRDIVARHPADQPRNLSTSLRICDGGSVVFSDIHIGAWTGSSPSQEEARAISALARVFRYPFGQDSLDVAQKLIERHGSLSKVLNAVGPKIGSPEHEAYSIIEAARSLIEACLNEQISSSKVDPFDPALLRFLQLNFRDNNYEQLQSVYLDKEMGFISHELIATGDHRKLLIDSPRLFRRCINLNASFVILAHNHPSGSAAPSNADRTSTRELQRMAKCLGVEIADHIIFGAGKAFSMRKGGML